MKKILTILLIGVLMFVFGGCSKTDNKQTANSTSTNQNSPPKNESQSTSPSTNNQSSSPATNGTSSNTNQQSSNTNQQSSSSTKSSSQTQKPTTVKTDKELAGEFGRDLVLKAVNQWTLDDIANTEFAKYPAYKENYKDFTYIFPGKDDFLRASTLVKIHGTGTPEVRQSSSDKFFVQVYISFNAEYLGEIRTYDGNVNFTVVKVNGQFKVYDTPVAHYSSVSVEFKP